jgi:hypothetical protein
MEEMTELDISINMQLEILNKCSSLTSNVVIITSALKSVMSIRAMFMLPARQAS